MTTFQTMKGAIQVLERALSSLADLAVPGITPHELSTRAGQLVEQLGARAILPDERNQRGDRFGFAACVCVNDASANAIPTCAPLSSGDLVTIDVALAWPAHEGANGRAVVDGATTCVVDGDEHPLRQLRDAARAATRACVAAAHPGVSPASLRAIAQAIAAHHGATLAEIPMVHRVNQGDGQLHIAIADHLPLQAGDIIAIEPLLIAGTHPASLVLDPDGFTMHALGARSSAYEECTMMVGDDEATPRILPPGTFRPWLLA